MLYHSILHYTYLLSIDSNYTTTTHTSFPYSLPHTRYVKRDSPHQVINNRRGPAVVSPHTFTCESPFCHVVGSLYATLVKSPDMILL